MLAALVFSLSLTPLPQGGPDFGHEVLPILSDRCFPCHGPDREDRKAELRLDDRAVATAARKGGPAIVPGDPGHSVLVAKIYAADPHHRMPPPSSGLRLDDTEKDVLRRWIAAGAPYDAHWSFVPPRRPRPPDVEGMVRNPIDAFVLDRLRRRGWQPAPEASRSELIRRVTFDLTGLPPTLAEIDAFEHDPWPDAYERLVDRLLASPRYGEHMALPWLDAARYADTNGYQGDRTRTSWPWRDWLIRALNDNLPFDRFTILQLAGDLLPGATDQDRIATGFHRNHMLNGEGGRIPEESRVDYVVDRVDTTATVWLGLTMGCARCHDHKFDPISQREYYRMFAFFNSIDETGAVDAGGNARPVLRLPTAEQRATLAALRKELAATGDGPDPAGQSAWERSTARLCDAPDDAAWKPLEPERVTARSDATLAQLADGSTLVTGANPDRDVYEVVAPVAGRLSGLRLDALTHGDFTNGYASRSDSGNFVLGEIAIELRVPDAPARPIALASALADFTQKGFDVGKTWDGDPDTGWAVHGDPTFGPHRAVFRFARPVAAPLGAHLAVRLEQRSRYPKHNLGRFRLAVTAGEPDLNAPTRPPAAVEAALRTAPEQRSEGQRHLLRDCYEASRRPVSARRAELSKRIEAVEKTVLATMVMRERAEPRTTHVLVRGQYDHPDLSETLTPGVPHVLPPLPAGVPADRLALARWLVSPQNPLVARVTVNRYWRQFFGTGLVKTVENFGVQGERPSHPRLLDWLATEYVRLGWDTKALQRLIVTSATYRQTAAVTAEQRARDPENRLLSRGPRRRLSSFAIRDQALAVSGLLVEHAGGPPVRPYQPAGVWSEATFGTIRYRRDSGDKLYRRSLYTFWRRIAGPTGLFDTADRQTCSVRKEPTDTPLHALVTLDDVTFAEAARVMAEHLLREHGSADERLRRAFRSATSRRPTAAELAVLRRGLERARRAFAADPAAARALASVGEAPVDPSLPAVELAATTTVCHTILNLDEALCR